MTNKFTFRWPLLLFATIVLFGCFGDDTAKKEVPIQFTEKYQKRFQECQSRMFAERSKCVKEGNSMSACHDIAEMSYQPCFDKVEEDFKG